MVASGEFVEGYWGPGRVTVPINQRQRIMPAVPQRTRVGFGSAGIFAAHQVPCASPPGPRADRGGIFEGESVIPVLSTPMPARQRIVRRVPLPGSLVPVQGPIPTRIPIQARNPFGAGPDGIGGCGGCGCW
jgi:hypothetical protein